MPYVAVNWGENRRKVRLRAFDLNVYRKKFRGRNTDAATQILSKFRCDARNI